ncbi:archaemetzincin family Zn-dependent metalloprotease [Anaeromyxobacter dehalogenans]|uniref:Peptidase predicted, zinc-dependent n=1 Tax=Anaeromyxobacter dehalogenans (strain 2CP-C) TaxID=290397 RepID=Q2IJF4_ANADE|nr:archaemetzincin family Zn-dependent metalloprotease [Anaeromyxobacter dehalogenans]ABC81780.1 peptidase predicted, zinc-dependent [Anaeromyxobacter dehalogenans 2CP-C]
MDPIFIWWIGEAAPDRALLDHAALHLGRAFGRPVREWSSPERPRHAYDPKRKQHLSGAILKWLLEAGPGAGKVLGVTDRDLFIPILTYVFGEGQLGGGAAVVSIARLLEDVELIGPQLLLERLAKEAVHEVGHAFGLLHCATPVCVMARSSGVRNVDEKKPELCSECRRRLEELQTGGPR